MKRVIEIVFTTVFISAICGLSLLQLCSGEQEQVAYAQEATLLRRDHTRRQGSTKTTTTEIIPSSVMTATTAMGPTSTSNPKSVATMVETIPSSVMTATGVVTMETSLTSTPPSGGPPKSGDSFGVGPAVIMAVVLLFVAIIVAIAAIAATFALMRMRVRKIRTRLLRASSQVPNPVHITARRNRARRSPLPDADVEKGMRKLTAQLTEDLRTSFEFNHRRFDREVDFSKLQLQEKLGTGAYGSVYKAIATDLNPDISSSKPTVVAVKVLKEGAQETERQALLAEIALMKELDPAHPHLVKMLGCCTAGEHVAMVMEFMPHGNLRDFLVKHRKFTEDSCSHVNQTDSEGRITEPRQNGTPTSKFKQMTTFKLLSLARQIAMGMDYLSSKNIVHGDLAARNVLIDREGKLCISGFGLSRDLFEALYCKSNAGKLLLRWMAVEAIVHRNFTVQSDVWSFGVVLWEIFTLGELPYSKFGDSEILQKLREGYRLAQPRNCPDELYQLMCDCWKEQSSERPSFGEIVDFLNRIIAQDEEAREHMDTTMAGYHSTGSSRRSSGSSSRRSSGKSSGRSSGRSGKSSNCGIEEEGVGVNVVCDSDVPFHVQSL